MKIYMDNCCYNRVLDDRTNPKIHFDRNTVLFILECVEKGMFDLIGSQMLKKEIEDTPIAFKREILEMMYSLCTEEIQVMEPTEWIVEVLNEYNN